MAKIERSGASLQFNLTKKERSEASLQFNSTKIERSGASLQFNSTKIERSGASLQFNLAKRVARDPCKKREKMHIDTARIFLFRRRINLLKI